MLAFTHAATGAFVSSAAGLITAPSTSGVMLLLLGGLVGSLMPDIDHPQSWLGRRIPLLSVPISLAVGHRGVTHSLFAVLLTSLGATVGIFYLSDSTSAWAALLVGLSLGYASHLFGDWASNSGIPLFWPNMRRYKSPVTFCTGEWEEKVMAMAMWLCSGYMAWHAVGI